LYYSSVSSNLKFASQITYDASWVASTDQTAQLQLETLHSRLLTAQSHLAKEAIRSAYVSLANFYKSRGALKEALTYILKSRDYCSTHVQTSEMCLQVIELSLDMKNNAQVASFVSKAQHTCSLLSKDASNGNVTMAKVFIASALCLMDEGKYYEAAVKFASASADLNNQFNTVISAEDIVLYGVILGLATFDRSAIQRIMFVDGSFAQDPSTGTTAGGTSTSTTATSAVASTKGSSSSTSQPSLVETSSLCLKQRLELLPWLSDLIQFYVRAEYGKFLSLLEQRRSELLLDMRLYPHLSSLYDMIRSNCMVQYLIPYSTVDLQVMKRQFDFESGTNASLENMLAELITTGRIHARINFQHGTITSKEAQTRKSTLRRVERLGEQFMRDAEAMLLRMACMEKNVVIQSDNATSSGVGRRRPMTRGGGGRLTHYAYGSGRRDDDMYDPGENDVSSDSDDDDDLVMHTDDEEAVMMEVSDSMVENTQSA